MEERVFDYLDNSVVIAPRELHDSFLCLKDERPELDFQVMDIKEFISMFTLQYDDRAIQELLVAEIPYRYTTELLEIFSSKTCLPLLNDSMKEARSQLIANHYLYPVAYPEMTFKGKNVIIAGYHYEKIIKDYLKKIKPENIISISPKPTETPNRTLYSFDDIYEEVHYLFNEIASDIESGTDINDIYVMGANGDYDMIFDEFGRHYGFEIESAPAIDLGHSKAYAKFVEKVFQGEKETEVFNQLVDEGYQIEDVEAIERVYLKYNGVTGNPDVDRIIIRQICQTKSAYKPTKTNVVRRLNGYIAPEGSHVYIVNFSMGTFPRIVEEDSEITDEKCEILGFLTSEDKNRENKLELSDLLNSDVVKYISFKKTAFGAEYFESSFVTNLKMSIVKSPISKYEYADDKGEWFLSILKDKYRNYLVVDKRLRNWEKEVPVPSYFTYDHSFKPFEIDTKYKRREYSASSIKNYCSCPFSYYASKILKIDSFEGTFESRAGDIYHRFLSDYYVDQFFDEELSWTRAVEDVESEGLPFSPKEQLFLNIIHEYALKALQFNITHENEVNNINVSTEDSFTCKSEKDPNITIKGRYDKILKFGDNQEYYCIIDLKTGGERFKEANLAYGLSIQLPLYAYYAKHDAKFLNKQLTGLFIAPILSMDYKGDGEHTYEEIIDKSFMMEGVFLADKNALSQLDPYYASSSYIYGCSLTSKGEFKAAPAGSFGRVKNEEQLNDLAKRAEEIILDVDSKVMNNNFEISPIKIGNEDSACAHCNFKAVCFMNIKDTRRVGKVKANGEAEEEEEDDELDE